MNISKFLISGLLLSMQAAVQAEPATVVIDNASYSIDITTGSYTNLSNQLLNTPWANDRNLASQIVIKGYELFGIRNDTDSPYVVYSDNSELYYYYVADFNTSVPGYSATGDFPVDPFPIYKTNDFVFLFGSLLPSGPSAADTLASMQPNASAMKNAFNSQYAALAYGLNHDCTVFDTNGVCVSVFGRNTSLNDSSYDNNAAGLILGYKPHAQFRVGTYIDQTVNNNTTGGVKVENSHPDVGVFGVWNMNADGSGLELRAAANYGKRDLNVSRSVVDTSEAGRGSSDLNAYGALLEASFSHALNDSWMAKPYAGVRYLSIKRDSYTERMTDDVQNPLRYSGLEQETTSAVVGVRFNGRLAPKLVALLNAGFEHDLHHSIDDYRATGVDDLGSINMNSQKDRTRPTAGLGIAYDVADKQRLSANVQYRKEIFMSESSVTGQVNYTIGF